MATQEPPRPQRGATAAERGPDTSASEDALAAAKTWPQKIKAGANPKYLLSQADGYPAGIKQFLQFCLIIIYPAWLLLVLLSWPAWAICTVLGKVLFAIWWFCTGWFWKRLGGAKPGTPEWDAMKAKEAEEQAAAASQGQ